MGDRPMTRLFVVKKRVLSPDCPYTPNERLVALAIADRMWTGPWMMSYQDIAKRTGLSPRTVQRCVKTLCDGPLPLFTRTKGGHRAYTFELVSAPTKFAAARAASNPSDVSLQSVCGVLKLVDDAQP